jgi:hypothetical protein
MGLLAETFEDVFNFWKQYFTKLFLYQLFFLIFYAIGGLLIFVGFIPLYFFGYSLSALGLFSILLAIGLITIIVFSSIQGGGYSLIVKQAAQRKKIKIMEIFKRSLKKIDKIIVVAIVQSLPILVIAGSIILVAYLMLSGNVIEPIWNTLPTTGKMFLPSLPITGMLAAPGKGATVASDVSGMISFLETVLLIAPTFVVIFLMGFYLSVRLWLSFPILMVEERGCVESLRRSWEMVRGKFWSIAATILLVGIIIGSMSLVIKLPFTIFGLSFIGNFVDYLIFTPISAIVPTIYYYHAKTERKR